jgi:hypothetical protein
MKARPIHILPGILVVVASLSLVACHESDDDAKISRSGSDESHNAGKNCMTCHSPGGSGEYVFTVAGTVYRPDLVSVHPGASTRFYAEANGAGDLVTSLEVDARGNFYTTEFIDLTAGPYVSVEGQVATHTMQSPVTEGACNACHGVTVDVIYAE